MFDNEITVVAFDLDNTLYNQDAYYIQVIKTFAEQKGLKDRDLIAAFIKVKDSSRDIFGDILKEVGLYSLSNQEELFKIYKTIDAEIALFPSAVEILEKLIEKNIRRAIITNGVIEVQKNKIRCLGIESLFDLIIYARGWGKDFEKPHAKPFQFLLNHFQCKPQNVLFFGDKDEIDIVGATNAGMKCELVNESCNFLNLIKKYHSL